MLWYMYDQHKYMQFVNILVKAEWAVRRNSKQRGRTSVGGHDLMCLIHDRDHTHTQFQMFVHTAHHHQDDSISMSLYFLISLIACVVVNLTWCRMKDSHLNSWIMSHDVRASITLINEYFIIRNKSVVKRLLTHFTTDTSLLNEWMEIFVVDENGPI